MQDLCRDRYLKLPAALFRLFTCSMCYKYLFHTGSELQPHPSKPWTLIPSSESSIYSSNFSVIADISDGNSVIDICKSLSDPDCKRWKDCCFSAISCCETQLAEPDRNFSEQQFCPRTWDGYGCFKDTPVNSRSFISCPSYVEHASTSETAYKDCTENGTWWVNPTTGSEWTNYTTCVLKQDYHALMYTALACNIVSLVLLIPACIIFIAIRQLRTQKRIKLHVCLFVSFILTSIVTILWDLIIYKDRLDNEKTDTIMHGNSPACKLLYILTRYVSTAKFCWMFCEGFYLHRLIVHAFSPPKTLIPYYIFGWVISWIPSIIYSVIRATNREYDGSCWVQNAGDMEWILYTPNLFCILANLIFLANILRILCSKLQAHPNEPNNYRKALKATFVLVPLFGLQQFLIIYRPEPGTKTASAYEIGQTAITDTQGAVVALIFCFCNGEVHTYLRNCLGSHIKFGSSTNFNRKSSMSSATQFTSVSGRRATRQYDQTDPAYIPLSTSSTVNDVSSVTTATTPLNGHVSFSV